MKKKNYEQPSLEIIELSKEDIIVSSGEDPFNPGDNELPIRP